MTLNVHYKKKSFHQLQKKYIQMVKYIYIRKSLHHHIKKANSWLRYKILKIISTDIYILKAGITWLFYQ